eukprot:CAMPEP_0119485538 /NCGR_PEP_ID=MMETSP1344-20130328/12220_1 /TAXON_ID=236787 /ORGANISM="Florenciella parvula, Strain CCMP2471" /LENGTH=54 /DNA_ID=CAMNT_0007520217 /DNA_START=137 /DNA_END=301 /DNA_ORIENTATION=+
MDDHLDETQAAMVPHSSSHHARALIDHAFISHAAHCMHSVRDRDRSSDRVSAIE